MCGRFNLTDSPAVHALLDDLSIDLGELPERYNIAPTEQVLTLRSIDGDYDASMMRWWLVPCWSGGPSSRYAMFNARAETLESSRAYRKPFQTQRAIVPVSSFIEWQRKDGEKVPYQISHRAEEPLLFAALWDVWQGETHPLYSCSIITTQASDSFAGIHHRQPVMFSLDEARQWMAPQLLASDGKALLRQSTSPPLVACEIDRSVNHAANKEKTYVANSQAIHLA